MKKRIDSFKYAFRGIAEGFKGQWNIKFHFFVGFLAILFAYILFGGNSSQFCIVLLCCGLVISMELINTAIEKLCDLIEPNQNEKIRVIKDISAGAVLISAIIAFIVGLIIFIPEIIWLVRGPRY